MIIAYLQYVYTPTNAHNQTGPRVSPHSLPEASTCDRRLSLPEYKTAAQLLAKLRAAITHGCVGYDRV